MVNLQAKAFVYILTNFSRSTLYVGVTASIKQRILDHKNGLGSDFCIKYNCDQLVFIKDFNSITEAISFEKRLKRWQRKWKEELIESLNPEWRDLSYEIVIE
ncbi:MAG: GIY-YIG nuclease family protein [Bacteroidota bacterium]